MFISDIITFSILASAPQIAKNQEKGDLSKYNEKVKEDTETFIKTIKEKYKNIDIIENRANEKGNSTYITLRLNNLSKSNPNRIIKFRFSNHAKNYAIGRPDENMISISPNEHNINKALEVVDKYSKQEKGLYSITVRKQYAFKPVGRNGKISILKNGKKVERFYVEVKSDKGFFFGESDKGAMSAINNIKNISMELKSEIKQALFFKVQQLESGRKGHSFSSVVQIINDIDSKELLSCLYIVAKNIVI